MAGGGCAEGMHGSCADWCCVSSLPGCPQAVDRARCLVCELCRLTVVWVDCRCFLSSVFIGGARRFELSLFHTTSRHDHERMTTMPNDVSGAKSIRREREFVLHKQDGNWAVELQHPCDIRMSLVCMEKET